MVDQPDLSWKPPGPVSARFMASMAFDQILNGPVGSGKTTTCFMKALALAGAQVPSPRRTVLLDGEATPRPVRMFKMTAVRDDYRQLWRSTIPSWNERFPQSAGEWSGAKNAPALHVLTFRVPDGTAIELIAEFVAIGDNDIEEFMRGFPTTIFYLNERDLLHPDVAKHAKIRVGRYPMMADGGPTWKGLLSDCNAPIIDSEFYNKEFLELTEAEGLFRIPGAFDAAAENRQNLPRDYYEQQIANIADPYLIKRMVHNQPAPSRSGKPVHEDFNDFLHVAPENIAAIAGLPIQIGMDAGLDPCAIFGQKLGNGRWNILAELVCAHGTGAVHFARLLNEFLVANFPDWHRIPAEHERQWQGMGASWDPMHGRQRSSHVRAFCDPAATYGGDKNSHDEADGAWCDIVGYRTGLRIEGAPTNNTTDRREGLRRVLTLMPDGRPAFQLSPRCKVVRAGLAGQFRYRKMNLVREERYTDEVDKNAFSHPCEALEYLMLGGGEAAEVHERRQRGWDVRNLPRQAVTE